MKLLVTGDAGFIGSTFVHHRLASTSDEITVVDKLTYAGTGANLEGLDADPAPMGTTLGSTAGGSSSRSRREGAGRSSSEIC